MNRLPRGPLVALVLFAAISRFARGEEFYRFASRPLQPGDQVTQKTDVGIKLRITTSGNTRPATSNKILRRQQRRNLTLLTRQRPDEPRATITFEHAAQRQEYAPGVESNLAEPIAGKTYLITRRGDRLIVTDPRGKTPPEVERTLVAASMEAFGRANPLSEFFNRRALAIGETIPVPAKVAEEIFSAWRDMIDVRDFDLTLNEVSLINQRRCGIFAARISSMARGASAPATELTGRMAIELDTCRIALIELAGPVTVSQTENGQDGPIRVDCQGTISVAMHNRATAK